VLDCKPRRRDLPRTLLSDGAGPGASATGHRLDHDKAEWLWPFDRIGNAAALARNGAFA
jgi:hypothetical protein